MRSVGVEQRVLVWAASAALALLAAATAGAEPVRISGWTLLTDPAGTLTASTLPPDGWRAAKDGRSWNAQFDDLRDYFGVAWYRATFTAPASGRSRHVLLRFGAVDYAAEVFVNGQRAGTHEGAYTPFTLDVTEHAKPGPNDLLVRVVDPPPTPPGGAPRFPDMPYEQLPRGKQNWYIENAGLWQPVWLDVRPAMYVESVRVTPKNSGAVSLEVVISGTAPGRPAALHVTLVGPDGRAVATVPAVPVAKPGHADVWANVSNPRLWSPATPELYTAAVSLDGPVADHVTARFGFREFTTRDGQFLLNGEPFYMRAALDQDFYPQSIYSTPDKAYVVDEMKKGRALGLNLLRCHIKVCDPTYLEAADETGMLVWYEVPSWDDWTTASVARGRTIFDAMVARDWNHPAIVIQSLINEAWGIDMTKADERAGLAEWFEAARVRTAPLGRLIVDNSACCDNFHVATDIDDFHQVPTPFPTTPTAGTAGWPISHRARRGPSVPTAMHDGPGTSRWSCRNSATGACRTCPTSCPGGSPATSTAGRSRVRRASSIDSRRSASTGSSPTIARSRTRPSGGSSRASNTRSRRFAGTRPSAATSSRSSPTSTGKPTGS